MEQAHIFFKGTVQGVGFRYTTRTLANECRLSGWVRNLPDGRVEVLAEGRREDIDRLCLRLHEHFEGYITGKTIAFAPASGSFEDFQIRH
jgi:acylphosphatase